MLEKQGRPREYNVAPLPGFASREVGFCAALLDELRERVYDQVEDLPPDALNFSSPKTKLTVGRLMLHLGWAEAGWIRRLSGEDLPPDLNDRLGAGALQLFNEDPPRAESAEDLIRLCGRVRDEVTLPYLRTVQDIGEARMDDGTTVQGVLMHLTWHWIYHSGHIGLIRLEWGSDYVWTVKRPLCVGENP